VGVITKKQRIGYRKLSEARHSEGNPNWRGDKVKYHGLHQWVGRHLPKPVVCDRCKMVPPLDLANKGIYDRQLSNWEWLCRRCHMLSDGRLDAMVTRNKTLPVDMSDKVRDKRGRFVH